MPLTFNATTDRVTCGDLTQIEGAAALTVVWRGRLSSVGGGGVLGLMVSKKDTFYLYDQGLGFLKFSVLGGGTSREYHVTAGGLETDKDYLFVSRWRASDDTLKIAINGVDKSLTQDVGGSVATLAANTNVLCIGQNSDGGYDSFQGDCKDVSVWSAYLDDATVAALFNGGTVSHAGTAQGGAASSITLASGASAVDDTYNGEVVTVGSESFYIADYVGSTRVATIAGTWVSTPTGSSSYSVAPGKSGEYYTTGLVGTWRLTDTSTLTDNSGNGWNGTNSGTSNGSLGPDVEYPPAVPPDPPGLSTATIACAVGTAGNFSATTVASHTSGDGTSTHVFALSPGGTLTLVFDNSVTFDGAVGDITINGHVHSGSTVTVSIAADAFTATNINGSTGNDAISAHAVTNNSAVYYLQANVRQYGVVVATLSGDDSVESDESDGMIVVDSGGGSGRGRHRGRHRGR